MKALGIIPARMGSTRFPGKPLAKINGRPMLEWTWRAASDAKHITDIFIATESRKIYVAAHGFGARAMMTSDSCRNGTEHTAEAAAGQPYDIILDIQADEPLIRPETIDRLIEAMAQKPQPDMATVVMPATGKTAFKDPNRVKVVTDRDGFALYFSRAPIPTWPCNTEPQFLQHIGIYAFRAETLRRITAGSPIGPLETREGLEQLHALEIGIRIKTIRANYPMMAVDTPDDIRAVSALLMMAEKQPSGRTRE